MNTKGVVSTSSTTTGGVVSTSSTTTGGVVSSSDTVGVCTSGSWEGERWSSSERSDKRC